MDSSRRRSEIGSPNKSPVRHEYCGKSVPYYNRDLGAQCSHPCRLDYGHAGECGIFRNERDPAERDDWQHDEGRWITDVR